MTPGSKAPDFPGTPLLPHVISTSLDTFCICLRFANKIPNCTKSEYIHASPKTAAKCHLPSHLHISGVFVPRSQPPHCSCHPSHLCMLTSRANYSLSWIPPANKPCFASSLQHAGMLHYPSITSSFLVSYTVGSWRSSHFLLETMVNVPGETPGDTWGLLLSVLLTSKIKYYFIIMQTKSTSLQGVFIMNVGEMTYLEVNQIANSHNSIFRISPMHTKQKGKKMWTYSSQKINICNTRKCDFLE